MKKVVKASLTSKETISSTYGQFVKLKEDLVAAMYSIEENADTSIESREFWDSLYDQLEEAARSVDNAIHPVG